MNVGLNATPHSSLLPNDFKRNGGIVFVNLKNTVCRVLNFILMGVEKLLADFLFLDRILEITDQCRVQLTCYAISICNSGFRPNTLKERFSICARLIFRYDCDGLKIIIDFNSAPAAR